MGETMHGTRTAKTAGCECATRIEQATGQLRLDQGARSGCGHPGNDAATYRMAVEADRGLLEMKYHRAKIALN